MPKHGWLGILLLVVGFTLICIGILMWLGGILIFAGFLEPFYDDLLHTLLTKRKPRRRRHLHLVTRNT